MGQEEDGYGHNPGSLAWPQQQLCRTKASIGDPCLGRGRQLEASVWEFLLSVQPTQDSYTPQRPCYALKATHCVSSPLRLLG